MGNPKSGKVSKPNFCVLEYLPDLESSHSPAVDRVVLLAQLDDLATLSIRVNPKLRHIVREADLPYIESLLDDFLVRARVDAERLFRQLCSLTAGPLVARTVGERLADHAEIDALASEFLPLSALPNP
jgi:hypothetical protein